MKYNTSIQSYKSIRIKLIEYTPEHFARLKAKRFMLIGGKNGDGNQNIWIPNCYLEPDGTLKPHIDIDWDFEKAVRAKKFKYADIPVPDWMDRRKIFAGVYGDERW